MPTAKKTVKSGSKPPRHEATRPAPSPAPPPQRRAAEKAAAAAPQAMRFNDGKPRLSFLLDFPNAMRYHAIQSSAGAQKYDLLNWKKGLSRREIMDSLLRHITAYAGGEELDAEGLPHLGGIVWNAMALAEMHHLHPELDDRFGKPKK